MTAPALSTLPDVDLDALTGESLACSGYPEDDCVNEPDYLITGEHCCGAKLHRMLCRECTDLLRRDWYGENGGRGWCVCPFCGLLDSVENFSLKIRPV